MWELVFWRIRQLLVIKFETKTEVQIPSVLSCCKICQRQNVDLKCILSFCNYESVDQQRF